MINTKDLFEDLRFALGCPYISDIKNNTYIEETKAYLKTMDLSRYSLAQLIDMSEYLYGEKQSFANLENAESFFRAH